VLRKNFYPATQVVSILKDYHNADLEPVEVAMMDFAAKISRDAGQVTAEDTQALRDHGLSDVEIQDIILAAAARNFFSRVLDATGAVPDPHFRQDEPELWAYVMGD
jgi:alkylhydroperoxidase family enzyme